MGIEGISHVTFLVRDLDKMAMFLCEGLGAEEVYDSKHKNFSLSRAPEKRCCNPCWGAELKHENGGFG